MERKLCRSVKRVALCMALVSGIVFALGGRASAAGTIRYAKQGGATSGSCLSWSTACGLRYALGSVAVAGDQIWVVKGTYKPGTTRSATFLLKNNVAVYGGFAGTETALSQRKPSLNVTILSGDIGVVGVATDNSYHVVTGSGTDSTAILDGFKIVGGNANAAVFPDFHGGGMLNNFGHPTLKNLTFTGNRADDYGGGMYNSNSSPRVDHVIFSGNTDTYYGAGMANGYNSAPTLTNLTFSNNTAQHGGGMFNYADSDPVMTTVTFTSNHAGSGGGMENDASSAPKLTNVSFNYNTATLYGGGMANYGASSPSLTNVRFINNSAGQTGGGMTNHTNSNPTLNSVTFSGNTTPIYGGGIYNYKSSPTLNNVTFSQNKGFYGGGLYNDNSSPTLKNVTFRGNTAQYSYGGAVYSGNTSTPKIYNAVLWGDITSEIYNDSPSSVPVISNSIVAGGCPSGTTCNSVVSADPVLGLLQNNGGFTKTMALGAGSAAIDRGNNATCTAKDQRGVSRPQGGTCDMGAYEVKALSHRSVGAYDGWLLESGENTNVGGTKDATAITLRVGDDSANRQYISLMSFDTSDLPDVATLVKARVKVKQHSVTHLDVAAQPTINTLFMDLKTPFYGSLLTLQLGDFQAAAAVTPAGSIDPTLVNGWYGGVLNSAATAAVSKTGTTQLRLRFVFDDNNNNAADYLSVYSGNAGTVSYRPLLIVYYNP